MQHRLRGQVVLVTGSTYGIGRCMVETFAEEGASVVVTGRSRDAGEAVASAIESSGGEALYVPMDIALEEDVRGAVAAAVARFGKLTGLVNNAAWVQGRWEVDGPITEIELENWERMLRVNLTGAFLASKYGLREIVRAGGGAVVNIASTAALTGHEGIDGYTAAKGALVSLTRSMAHYYSRYDVRTNCIVSGFVDTGEPTIRAILEDSEARERLLRHYLGRVGRPSDIATMAAHLLSDDGAFMNGAIVAVEGGSTSASHVGRRYPDMPGFPSRLDVDGAVDARIRAAGSDAADRRTD